MKELEFYMDVIKAFFGMLFSILIGTTTVLQGELIGIVFSIPALYSAIWLGILLFKLKGEKNDTNS